MQLDGQRWTMIRVALPDKAAELGRSMLTGGADDLRPPCDHPSLQQSVLKSALADRESQRLERTRFADKQIIGMLRVHEGSTPVLELSRKHGVSDSIIYDWKANFGCRDASEAKRLKMMREDENAKQKRLLADAILAPHHNWPLPPSIQQPTTSRSELKLDKTSMMGRGVYPPRPERQKAPPVSRVGLIVLFDKFGCGGRI